MYDVGRPDHHRSPFLLPHTIIRLPHHFKQSLLVKAPAIEAISVSYLAKEETLLNDSRDHFALHPEGDDKVLIFMLIRSRLRTMRRRTFACRAFAMPCDTSVPILAALNLFALSRASVPSRPAPLPRDAYETVRPSERGDEQFYCEKRKFALLCPANSLVQDQENYR